MYMTKKRHIVKNIIIIHKTLIKYNIAEILSLYVKNTKPITNHIKKSHPQTKIIIIHN